MASHYVLAGWQGSEQVVTIKPDLFLKAAAADRSNVFFPTSQHKLVRCIEDQVRHARIICLQLC